MTRPRLPCMRPQCSAVPSPKSRFSRRRLLWHRVVGPSSRRPKSGIDGICWCFLNTALGKSALARCKLWGDAREGQCLSEFRERIETAIPALRRYARALTRDTETADDIVQDTLVRALRSEHLFHGGDMRAWLYTILTNLNRNRLRTLARRPVVSPIKDTDATASGPDSGGRDIVRALEMLT